MYECSSCSNTYAWLQSLKRHIKNKHNAKDDETVSYEKDIISLKSSDNITPATASVNQPIFANTVVTSPSYPYKHTLSPVHMYSTKTPEVKVNVKVRNNIATSSLIQRRYSSKGYIPPLQLSSV